MGTVATLGDRFDRSQLRLPEDIVLLPDIADDMDVTQTLAISVVARALRDVPDQEGLYRDTAVIVAMEGKTERGVEATLRVLERHLARRLEGTEDGAAITEAAAKARPSGPYTLQCMMPNVAPGRAASRLSLQGPNFVVDASRGSVDAALHASRLVLGDDVRMAVVTALCASQYLPHGDCGEVAAAFVVTTPALAQSLDVPVLCRLQLGEPDAKADDTPLPPRSGRDHRAASGAVELLDAIRLARAGAQSSVHFPSGTIWTAAPHHASAARTVEDTAAEIDTHRRSNQGRSAPALGEHGEETETPRSAAASRVWVHEPVWVPEAAVFRHDDTRPARLVVVAPNVTSLVQELLSEPSRGRPDVVVLVPGHLPCIDDARVRAVDVSDEVAATASLAAVPWADVGAVVAVDRPADWGVRAAIAQAATGRDVLDLLFLVTKHRASALRAKELQLFSLSLAGVDGEGRVGSMNGLC